MSRSGSENRKKTVRKSIRFDPEEWKEIEAQIDRAGLTLGELVRHQCLGTALPPRKLRLPPMDQKLASQLLGQLGKIGSNMNQVAHAVHLDRHLQAMHEAALIDLIEMRTVWFQTFGKMP